MDKKRERDNGVTGKTRTRFTEHDRSTADVGLDARPYADLEPPQVDEKLAVYSGEVYKLRVQVWERQDYLTKWARFQTNPEAFRYERYKYTQERADKYEAEVEVLNEQIAVIQERDIKPLADEFAARGGWNRFFLVASSNGGHVHRSQSCSTCNVRTRFIWLTDESGKSEEEIVELAGDGACTVCYPSAPVADPKHPRPNPFEDPEVKAAREQRAAEKAARDAAKAAKGITTPLGEPLVGKWGAYKTERAAEIDAIQYLTDAAWYDSGRDSDENLEIAARIQVAIAFKRGVPVAEVQADWEKKAKAKAKRDQMNFRQVDRLEKILASFPAQVEKLAQS
jgi:hypothetical protein